MKFAQRVFLIAGSYGLLVTIPMFFAESVSPEAILQPDLLYGFACVTLAWQVAFLVISRDPVRFRLMMLPSMLEKLTYATAMVWLFSAGRVPALLLGFGLADLLLGVLFVVSFMKTADVPTVT